MYLKSPTGRSINWYVNLSFLSLLYLYTISSQQADKAIDMFDLTLTESDIYDEYKHLNPYFHIHKNGDWLTPLSIRFRRNEWKEFRLWLKVVILDIHHKKGYSPNILNSLLKK